MMADGGNTGYAVPFCVSLCSEQRLQVGGEENVYVKEMLTAPAIYPQALHVLLYIV